MDLSLDLSPKAESVAQQAAGNVHSANVANPTPTQPSASGHPSYDEMVTAAIAALDEPSGSSKRSIANYLERNFSNLPPNHSELLTHHMKRLKDDGQVLLVKHFYMLPGSRAAASVAVNEPPSDPASASGNKKRPGRPPKLKSVQDPVPVFGEEQPLQVNDTSTPVPGEILSQNEDDGQLGSVYISVGADVGAVSAANKRGRGRPPKLSGVKRGVSRPPKISGTPASVGRGRGRPKKTAVRSRGRPRKQLSGVEGGVAAGSGGIAANSVGGVTGDSSAVASVGITPVSGKRRGRPPNLGAVVKKPRKLPMDEPRKLRRLGRKNVPSTASKAPVNHLLKAYLDLKGKLEHFQSTIKKSVSILKPGADSETAVSALQELEALAGMDVSSPNVHT